MKYDVICPSNCHSTGYEKNVRCINNTKYHNMQITIDKSQLQNNVIFLASYCSYWQTNVYDECILFC